MKDTTSAFYFDLTDLDRQIWMSRVDDIAEDAGYAEPVGPDHMALLIDGGRSLIVAFETVPRIRRQNDGAAPLGWGFVQSHGWSSLTIMAEDNVDWFRHPAVYGYFDRLIDDGFFDDFDEVLFYGAGAAGYAAAAYSVAAPDARVLVLQPQATLDVRRTPWDRRFPQARRLDFSSRFGYAPMMVETASKVSVIHDPTITEDAVHAGLFDGGNTDHFLCPYIGPDAERALMGMDVFPDLIDMAMEDSLTPSVFATLWRARQSHLPYLRTMFHRLDGEDRHERLLARLCRAVDAKGDRPMFGRKLKELEAQGVTL